MIINWQIGSIGLLIPGPFGSIKARAIYNIPVVFGMVGLRPIYGHGKTC